MIGWVQVYYNGNKIEFAICFIFTTKYAAFKYLNQYIHDYMLKTPCFNLAPVRRRISRLLDQTWNSKIDREQSREVWLRSSD